MQMVIIVDRSNGNESVGDMWKDTYIFDSSATLAEVIERTHGKHFLEHETSLANTVIQKGKS